MAARPSRAGYTLIEVLVVIAIVALVVGLLLPAVQRVRDAAARTGCQNNLKQLGLAALAYESAHATLPPSLSVSAPNGVVAHGWGTYLLPYLEQAGLAARYDFGKSFADPGPNQGVVSTQVRLLLCPNTVGPGAIYSMPVGVGSYLPSGNDPGGVYRAAAADYTPVRAVHRKAYDPKQLDIPESDPRFPADRSGILNGSYNAFGILERPRRVADVTDGTAATLLFVEAAGRPNLRVAAGDPPASPLTAGAGWGDPEGGMFGLLGSSDDGLSAVGTCFVNCRNDHALFGPHRGGANAGFGDGSVRFVGQSASPVVVAASATARGGEVVTWD